MYFTAIFYDSSLQMQKLIKQQNLVQYFLGHIHVRFSYK